MDPQDLGGIVCAHQLDGKRSKAYNATWCCSEISYASILDNVHIGHISSALDVAVHLVAVLVAGLGVVHHWADRFLFRLCQICATAFATVDVCDDLCIDGSGAVLLWYQYSDFWMLLVVVVVLNWA